MTVVRRQVSFWDGFPESKITRQFRQFHAENPRVFAELHQLAKQAKAQGRTHYSINALFEIVRWHRTLDTTDTEFKLRNAFRAYYARLIMKTDPSLQGFFRTCASKADEMY